MKLDLCRQESNNTHALYYQGLLEHMHTTPGNNLLLSVVEPKKIINGVFVNKCINQMNFLVPKRREKVLNYAKGLSIGSVIRIKLLQEPRSKKWTVSAIERTV